jgi:hypothetical protein
MLDVWESQTNESALGLHTCYIAPRHILELTLEVILELTLEVTCAQDKNHDIFNPGSLATAHLYLGINTGVKVMILFLVIVLASSQDWSWSTKHAPRSFFCRSFLSLMISILVSQPLLLNYSRNTCCLNSALSFNLTCLPEVGQEA